MGFPATQNRIFPNFLTRKTKTKPFPRTEIARAFSLGAESGSNMLTIGEGLQSTEAMFMIGKWAWKLQGYDAVSIFDNVEAPLKTPDVAGVADCSPGCAVGVRVECTANNEYCHDLSKIPLSQSQNTE